ncbi:type I DNA topoisomerase [Paenibacillus sp. TRM 82003]|uniref:type I DNA topoisomerase n=1 Tax=Kineococcus sp. TRM81007 TaxID=2925831 RepID=UPI001F5914E4|nr:type I DNA topoisomerase [Kineococcus sp. TRM81007]MCI2239482.1 type I DNA topoisomerase [Kineococcus sp. TRM81007]MCI3919282.1 type I DNA topoisomerase [Paenibacillus sp. TRM 82003]
MAGKSKAAGTGDGLRRLVIVESASKIDKISTYLGPGYQVEASYGHIRDLPQPSQLPEDVKKGSFGKFAVDVDHGFEPYYVVDDDKKKKVNELKRALKEADELILATDRDREGEAIAWHLVQALEPRVPYRRMVFGEITREAIQQASQDLRDIDDRLVDAQETRRILDRIYGYELSPVLWRKIRPKLSAGRVQSVATRLCVERERERMAFRAAGYADVTGRFTPGGEESAFGARLVALDGRRVAAGRDFDDSGQLKPAAVRDGVAHLDVAAAESLARALDDAAFAVRSVEEKPYSRRPAAPFITSSLQQEASRKLRLNARQAMRVAQGLYERGYITYMRTDSIQLSAQALNAARSQARELYGPEYVPDSPRVYASKTKNAQEAHEAIRPAGEVFRTPAQVSGELRGDDFRLYDLIWKRTVASQMHDARGTTATVRLGATSADGRDAEFSASGTIITFRGFLAAYEEGRDETRETEADATDRRLPPVQAGQPLTGGDLAADGHVTSPPPRYTEASLVKTLEEKEIGRPSTFASIISTIVDRGYVRYKGSALVPTWLAFAVTRLLEEHFPQLVDYDFTASMENDLDAISRGEAERVDWLTRFYFGADGPGDPGVDAPGGDGAPGGADGAAAPAREGIKGLADDLGKIDAREISTVPIGEGVVLRVGRYGPYLEGPDLETGELLKASVPEEIAPDEMTVERARELLTSQADGDRVLGQDPATGRTVVARTGRYGPYVTELIEDDAPAPAAAEGAEGAPKKRAAKKTAKAKPRTSSLFKDMSVETVTLEQALELLSLPRVVGTDPESGDEITAQNGRYGPYLKKGTDSRSLASEDQLLTITLEEALAIYAQPKTRRGQTVKPPLKELGVDPESGQPMVVKDGRFGPYVTDGTTNATLRKDDDPETITPERGAELLAEKRAKGPAPKKKAAAKKTAAKKTATKRTAAKKTAAKTSAATAE